MTNFPIFMTIDEDEAYYFSFDNYSDMYKGAYGCRPYGVELDKWWYTTSLRRRAEILDELQEEMVAMAP